MNETPANPPIRFFHPITLLAGLVLGLVGLAWAGHAVTGHSWHPNFTRFHLLLTPEAHYQPTVGEMRAIVRARCRPDQILVIVGGNSIFQGFGQPVEKLWSLHLQELLGARYAVVNLAFRGSSPTDGGAVVAESLRDEFPRQIYLANVPPFGAASAGGALDYRFIVLDAYYKGWLLDFPARQAVLDDYIAHPGIYPAAREINWGARLDAPLRFRDFWNWVSTTTLFTFPTPHTSELARAFRPRDAFPDTEPDFETIPIAQRFRPEATRVEMEITRNTTAPFYQLNSKGEWSPNEAAQQTFVEYARDAFPAPLKSRTLIVLSPNAPFYTSQLSPTEQARDERAFLDCIARWRDLGYAAMRYGPGFTDADFGDRTHLTASGGRKLAAQVAPEIRQLAENLGYLKP